MGCHPQSPVRSTVRFPGGLGFEFRGTAASALPSDSALASTLPQDAPSIVNHHAKRDEQKDGEKRRLAAFLSEPPWSGHRLAGDEFEAEIGGALDPRRTAVSVEYRALLPALDLSL